MNGKSKSPANLRGLTQLTFFLCICVWQTFPALIGMVLFILLVRVLRINWKYLAGAGAVMSLNGVVVYFINHHTESYFSYGWLVNVWWWKISAFNSVADGLHLSFGKGFFYVMSVPIPMVGIMAVMELIPGSAHEQQMRALQRGNVSGSSSTIHPIQKSPSSLERALKNIYDAEHDGTVLGVSRSSGKPVVMSDDNVNQLALVLGTTGGGKTVTLRRFYRRAMLADYPLIIVDGKPTAEAPPG